MSQALLKTDAELPPIVVERVPMLEGDGVLVARTPLVFYPKLMPSGKYYEADYDPIHIWATEDDYDKLEPAILDQIAFVWESYVEHPETKLSPGAIKLKQNILEHFAIEK